MDRELLDHLTRIEKTRARAWLERDRGLLSGLLDEDFVEINYFGRLTRGEILNGLFPNLTLKKFDMDGFRLLGSSGELAILSYRADEVISFKGSEMSGIFHVTSVYRNTGGEWRILVWQITPFVPKEG